MNNRDLQEGTSRATSINELRKKLRVASDEDLLQAYLNPTARGSVGESLLPKLPTEEIQRSLTGLSDLDAFRQAIAFLRVVRDFAENSGAIFGAPAQRILDFGCGWGRITQLLLPFFEADSIYGIDVMPSALDLCRESGLRTHLQRISPWPPSGFPDSHFDYIVAYSVFSHLSEENSNSWIREFSKILKPGGIVAFTTRHRDFILYGLASL